MDSTLYDGKAFVITTPAPDAEGRYLAGWLTPVDGSLPPRRIMSAVHGFQYELDDGSGKNENSITGPWVGDEINMFLRRTGGCPASENQPALEPEDGFTVAQIFQPCVPVTGGPNAGPDIKVTPLVLTPDPAPPAPAAPQTPSAVPVGAPLPPNHVAVHESVLQRAADIGHQLENGIDAGVRGLGRELGSLFGRLKAKL